MTTWSIDFAFMIDTGDLCTREEMERVGWDKTRDTVLVSEDLATGGIRAHLVSAKGNGDPWIAGKIKDDIEEFGYGGALVRIKSDQEPAIVDVQRAVSAKRGNAPTIPVNSPVGDSQSNGRVESAIKKVRNMVKTILSSLESRWSIRVARDHPVYPWVFEWAADLMTRYAQVGDLGKTAVQLIRGSKSSRNIAQFGEKILYKPLKLSGHHRGNMEDIFLDGIFLGMRLRSDEILIGTARGVIKTRTLRRRVEEEQWDPEFAKSIKGEPRQPVPGINSDHVPAAISDRAGVRLEEDQPNARLAQQDEFIDPPEAREVSMPPDRLVTQVRSDTLKRMYVTRGLGKKYGPTPGCSGCATVGSHDQASHSDTCRDRMRAELEKIEEGREYLAREQARVDAGKQEQPSSSSQKSAVSEDWDRPPEKFWRMGEEDVRMKQDITATSGASSSSASRGPAMDTESRPSRKRAADVQTEDLEDNEQLDANENAASPHKRRRSLLTEECSLAIGNTSSLKRTSSVWETKVAGHGCMGLDESMDITTVNEQGVQWDFTDVEMRNEAFRKTVAEKPFLLMGAHPCASWRSKSNASWSRMTQRERKMTSCTEPEYTCSLFVACTSCSTMKDGTSYMNTAKASCHGRKIAWKKFRR